MIVIAGNVDWHSGSCTPASRTGWPDMRWSHERCLSRAHGLGELSALLKVGGRSLEKAVERKREKLEVGRARGYELEKGRVSVVAPRWAVGTCAGQGQALEPLKVRLRAHGSCQTHEKLRQSQFHCAEVAKDLGHMGTAFVLDCSTCPLETGAPGRFVL